MSVSQTSRAHVRRPRVNGWLLTVAGLAAAVVGLSAWIALADRGASTPRGLASPEVAAMLEARIAALNSSGKQPMARFYGRDAVQQEFDVVPPTVTRGGTQIAARNEGFSRTWALMDQRVALATPVVQVGDYAAHGARIGGTDYVLVFKLDRNGKIEHQWVVATPSAP